MHKQLLFSIAFVFNFLIINAQQYSRVRIDLRGHSMEALAQLGIGADHGTYVPNRYLETDLSRYGLFSGRNSSKHRARRRDKMGNGNR